MITRLGLVSGEILELLDTMKEPVHIDNFKEHVDVPGDVILMSLGWLIREGYVYLLPHATGVEVRRNGIS